MCFCDMPLHNAPNRMPGCLCEAFYLCDQQVLIYGVTASLSEALSLFDQQGLYKVRLPLLTRSRNYFDQ